MYQNDKFLEALYSDKMESILSQKDVKTWITTQSLGELFLPTGKIVANDPLCLYETAPFEKAVAPGKYPVTLYLLHYGDDTRVAYSEIRFSNATPVSFETATRVGDDIATLAEDEFFGYGVDSGTGGFTDYETCMEYDKMLRESEKYTWAEMDALLAESYVDTYSTANICLPESEKNVIAFSSGYGDGVYPSFWGLDQNNQPCRLITDFCIIDDGEDDDDNESELNGK
ncbi:DUF4241 domain-containing protein [Clostridium merdae]|uniref:DUF4241 domain-containing protein n=1 Tax=Clostridium merdae TaxID=1958780 RepID=UPI000A26F00B|nr:DUF4241 domain-containing protein [Clostridium merdae]